MKTNWPCIAGGATWEAEFCIVGGGVAGLFMALQLGRAGKKCVLLEAGSSKPIGDWRNLTWFDPERDFTECDTDHPYKAEFSWVKALGGGAEAWEAYTPRWVEEDFQLETKYGVGIDWPFEYSEIEHFYGMAEQFLGVAGTPDNPHDAPRSTSFPLPAFEFESYEENIISRARDFAWHHVPQARNSLAYGGRSHCNAIGTCNSCPVQARWSPSATLVPAIRAMQNVRLLTDSVVLRVEADENNSARVLHLHTKGIGNWMIRPQKLILAAGAVETARLLLLSTSQRNSRGFLNESGRVGKGFMDHPVLRISADIPWKFDRQMQTNILASSHDFRRYDPETGSWGFLVNLNSRRRGKLWIASHMEMPPCSDNQIQLSSEKSDKFGRPVARLQIRSSWQGFQATLDRCRRVLGEVTAQAEGKNAKFDPFQLWACHPMGGCPIGSDENSGVLRPDLRAWESANTYILSLGVFPTGAAVNPTLTLLALAFRLKNQLLHEE